MSLNPRQSRCLCVALQCSVLVLTEDAAKVAPGEKDTARTIVTLQTRLLPKVRRDGVDLDRLSSNQTHACFLVPIDTAQSGTEVAIPKVRVRK